MILETCKLSLPLNTSGCTLVADLSKGSGKNLVLGAKNSSLLQKITGIFQEDGLMENFVKNVISKNRSKQERFLLIEVGSVRVIRKKTIVYNLTINGTPAFDTEIGISHNTQKPVPLLKKLISIFTDEGDVVIDPVAGSGSTLVAAHELNRKAYGFEIKKDFYKKAQAFINVRKAEKAIKIDLFEQPKKEKYQQNKLLI